jgi:hypothetical protein
MLCMLSCSQMVSGSGSDIHTACSPAVSDRLLMRTAEGKARQSQEGNIRR